MLHKLASEHLLAGFGGNGRRSIDPLEFVALLYLLVECRLILRLCSVAANNTRSHCPKQILVVVGDLCHFRLALGVNTNVDECLCARRIVVSHG